MSKRKIKKIKYKPQDKDKHKPDSIQKEKSPKAGISRFSLRASMKFVLPVIALTFIVFLPVIHHEFIFWDDPQYTTNNPHIGQIDLPAIFSDFYFGNYHPLTLLSYAIEYKFAALEPSLYHFDNLLLHLLNTFLVFVFISLLSNKKSMLIPTVTALLFAIHPMHVESVAWVSERKDVLFSFFFLAALICYLKYIQKTSNKKYLLWTFVLFLLSLFSKAQAVPLPLLLPLIDWFKGRKINKKSLIEKIPFFALALLFGILAIKAQQAQEAINIGYYSKMKSVFWGSYGLIIYLVKSLLPLHLSGVYPYPLEAGREMPGYIYLFPLFVLVLLVLVWKFRNRSKELLFGMMFFLFVISVVLKFIPVGDAVIAERYSYMPYLGLFFIIATFFHNITEKKRLSSMKKGIYTIGLVLTAILAYSSYNRSKVWHDTRSFWSDVVEKQPHYWQGYSNLAQNYFEAKEYEKAIELYSKATEMDPNCPPIPWLWRGMIYTDHLPDYDKAIADFLKVMSFRNKADQSYIDASINLGLAYYRKNDLTKAIEAHNNAVAHYPNNPRTYFLRGLTLKAMQKDQEALADFNKAIQLKPDYYEALLNRGVIYTDRLAQYEKAIADFRQVLRLNPSIGNALLNIGLTYYKMGQVQKSIDTYNQYLQSNTGNGRAYYLRAISFAAIGKFQRAVEDATRAGQLGNPVDTSLLKQWESKSGR